ncbi:hypothetical protein GCM10011521_01070 [Arenimonas soli]|uniref:Glycosyltransferase subfamily 4-like N-terminal domain-containing protein n=1 Tax=Arenimonas soli TaxID=2269504 RepID=A0ABQ1H9F8_9GAMM|nr:glycosyltransferase [Arenimonas soli]GGA66716.1 hypothetical protein GCM10011521_01070 [Arenimonas soli]
MRLLLIAYDFPPVPSPQSLRWAYLVRELARAGHQVHVLAPDVPGYGPGGLPQVPDSVRIHRVFPGPFMGLLAAWQRRRIAAGTLASEGSGAPAQAGLAESCDKSSVPPGGAAPVLNWKGRLRERLLFSGRGLNWKGELADAIKRVLGLWLFPDARAEWMPWARRSLDRLLKDVNPDAVVTSHEPANSIELGLRARKRGFRWIADLGDPVLAPYTPRRWLKRAHGMERAVCEKADVVTVTSLAAGRILSERHGLSVDRCVLVTQGFDDSFDEAGEGDPGDDFDADRLELLYTGSFYSFRRVGHLLDAVLAVPGARLNVASIAVPPELVQASRKHPGSVRLLGFLAHRRALLLQRRCDILVNLANDDPVQVPGKLYEYLGAGVPVLHVGGHDDDAAARLLRDTEVGVCSPDAFEPLRQRLQSWLDDKRRLGRLPAPRVAPEVLAPFTWRHLAGRVAELAAGRAR